MLRAGLAAHFDCRILTPGPEPVAALKKTTEGYRVDGADEMVLVVDQCEELWALSPPDNGDHDQIRTHWNRQRRQFFGELSSWADRRRTAVVVGLRADHFSFATNEPLLRTALTNGHQIVVTPMNKRQLSQVIEAPAARRDIQVDPVLVQRLLEELAVTDSDSEPGALPLLSYALKQSWANLRPPRKVLKYDDYHKTGGIRGAIEKSAEGVYASLSPRAQLAAKRVLMRCVAVTEESTARRTAIRSELQWDDLRRIDIDTAIGRFAEERLITVSAVGVQASHEALLSAWQRLAQWIDTDRASLLQHRRFSVESREWERGGRAQKDLLSPGRTEEFTQWAADEVHGRELNPLEQQFLAANVAFHAEQAAKERRRVAELNETVHRLRISRTQLRRRARVLLWVAFLLTIVTVVASAAVVEAVDSRNRARTSAQVARTARNEAFSRLAAVQSGLLRNRDSALAQQLALVGWDSAATVEARSALLDSTAVATPRRTPTVPGTVVIAVSPGSKWLAVGNSDGNVRLLDRADTNAAPTLLAASTDPLYAVAFTPDGRRLAVGGVSGATLWDVSTPRRPRKLTSLSGITGPVYDLSWSPDGREVAAATTVGALRWSVDADGSTTALTSNSTTVIKAVAYSPGGQYLATGTETGAVQLWIRTPGEPDTPAGTVTMPRATDGILDLQFDPSSTRLAVGSQANECTLLDVTQPEKPSATMHLGGFTSYVNSVAFRNNGTAVAAGSSDNSVRLFDLSAGTTAQVLPGSAIVTSVANAGDTVISAATDGFIREWPLPGPVSANLGGRIYTLPTSADGFLAAVGLVAPVNSEFNLVHRYDLTDSAGVHELLPALLFEGGGKMSGVAAVSGDGRIVAAGTADGELYTWDVSEAERPHRFAPPVRVLDRVIATAVLSHDGRHAYAAAAGDAANRIAVVDFADPANPRTLETLTANGLVQLLTVSSDGTLLAASTANGVSVWDVSGTRITPVADLRGVFDSTVTAAKFGAGRLLAAGSDDRTVKLWDFTDPRTPAPMATLTGPSGAIMSLTFDPSGHRLAAGTGDNQVWVWDVGRPASPQPYAALNAYPGRVNDVAFSPDGSRLIAAGFDGTLRTWHTDPVDIAQTLCHTPASTISAAEWKQYFPETTYTDPCK